MSAGEADVSEGVLIRTEAGTDGVLLATIDMPGRTMNVFSAELMDALDALMDRVDADTAVQSVVLTSGKPSFLAGADLVMVRGFTTRAASATREEMFALCGRLGRQFVRLEASAKPWVAAVNGIALGGGLELALACRVRLVTDAPRTQLGTPEVRWGLLPGAGGTQRLPRLIGFAPALDLLLTGRSVDPAAAVQLGLFARAVPAASLVDEARATARALHGQPYDAHAKFVNWAQEDVPAQGEANAEQLAARFGVSAENFRLYPAHHAIVDSVLKGARLPLAEATAVEMQQFLRLMFDPVAGRMVRTLFLERLRAEHDLAAPAGTRIAAMRHGPLSAARQSWADALGKCKLPWTADAALPADTLEIEGSHGEGGAEVRVRVALRVLDDPAPPTSQTSQRPQEPSDALLAVLTPMGPYGRVLEIIGADEAAAALLALLASRLGALPWRTGGGAGAASVLWTLRGAPLDEQARTALLALRHIPGPCEPAFTDAAACLSGVAPAWSGGPLTHLWESRDRLPATFDGEARAAWVALQGVLQT